MSFDTFRSTLKRHREARRWSQERLALECAMDHSLVSRIESGQRGVTREAVAKLCAGLELPGAERDRLYLLAGYLPLDISADEMWAALTLVRNASETAISSAFALIAEARRMAA